MPLRKSIYNSKISQPILQGLVADGLAAEPLTDRQEKALQRFISLLGASEYVEVGHPCLCGASASADILVACKDRYGIPLRTVLCKRCGLMRSDPCLSLQVLPKFYQQHYRSIYDRASSMPAQSLMHMMSHGQDIYQFLQEHNVLIPKYVFEIGCGTGGNLVFFLLQSHIVKGCDYGRDFLEVGRRLGLDLREGGLEMLGDILPPSLVIFCHTLEHFWDPLSKLILLSKKLPEASLVYIELPGIYSIHRTYGNPLLFFQNAHIYHFCLQSLDYVLSLAGFERVYGNEYIQAIYRLNPALRSVKPDPKLHQQICSYLRNIERRWQFSHRFLVQHSVKLIHRLMRGRLYQGARRMIKLNESGCNDGS